jgi:hypothetical protein
LWWHAATHATARITAIRFAKPIMTVDDTGHDRPARCRRKAPQCGRAVVGLAAVFVRELSRSELFEREHAAQIDECFALGIIGGHAGLALADARALAKQLAHVVERAVVEPREGGEHSIGHSTGDTSRRRVGTVSCG